MGKQSPRGKEKHLYLRLPQRRLYVLWETATTNTSARNPATAPTPMKALETAPCSAPETKQPLMKNIVFHLSNKRNLSYNKMEEKRYLFNSCGEILFTWSCSLWNTYAGDSKPGVRVKALPLAWAWRVKSYGTFDCSVKTGLKPVTFQSEAERLSLLGHPPPPTHSFPCYLAPSWRKKWSKRGLHLIGSISWTSFFFLW